MPNRKKAKTGDLIKIPFHEGTHTYGRILVEGSYAIYDCSSTYDRRDYNEIINSEILFVAHVDIFAIKEDHWTIITNIPLEEKLLKFYPRYFNPSPFSSSNIGFYEVYKAEIEEAIQKDWIKTGRIQLDGINAHFHIEGRLNDFYNGRRNDWNRRNIWIFKKYLGLPLDNLEDFK